jgi:hypothetical protein
VILFDLRVDPTDELPPGHRSIQMLAVRIAEIGGGLDRGPVGFEGVDLVGVVGDDDLLLRIGPRNKRWRTSSNR